MRPGSQGLAARGGAGLCGGRDSPCPPARLRPAATQGPQGGCCREPAHAPTGRHVGLAASQTALLGEPAGDVVAVVPVGARNHWCAGGEDGAEGWPS